MKFNPFRKTETLVVEQDPNQPDLTELENLLKAWGAYSTGDGSYGSDNKRRNELLESIVSEAVSISKESLEKSYKNTHMDVYETQVLNFEILRRRNENKNEPTKNL